MQRWMAEALLQPVALVIRTLRMHFSQPNLLVCWHIVAECVVKLAVDDSFEYDYEKDRGHRGDPRVGFEAILEANSYDEGQYIDLK